MENQKLTVSQALSQGYEFYGFTAGERWQTMHHIKKYDPMGERSLWKAVLFEKEPSKWPSIDADTIRDLITDQMESDWIDKTGSDDVSSISDALKAVDLTDITAKINEAACVGTCCYTLTSIELIAD